MVTVVSLVILFLTDLAKRPGSSVVREELGAALWLSSVPKDLLPASMCWEGLYFPN